MGIFNYFQKSSREVIKVLKFKNRLRMMPKHVFGTQNPKLGLFNIFKSHLKRSIKVLTFLNRLRMMPNRVFSTQNHEWGLFTIFKTHLPKIGIFNYFQKSSIEVIKVLKFLNRLRLMPKHVFCTQNPKLGLFTILKVLLREV